MTLTPLARCAGSQAAATTTATKPITAAAHLTTHKVDDVTDRGLVSTKPLLPERVRDDYRLRFARCAEIFGGEPTNQW